jgi:hypothetical protein
MRMRNTKTVAIPFEFTAEDLRNYFEVGSQFVSEVEVTTLARYLKHREYIQCNAWPRPWRVGSVQLPTREDFTSRKLALERGANHQELICTAEDC